MGIQLLIDQIPQLGIKRDFSRIMRPVAVL
jgi:hypothetical protein